MTPTGMCQRGASKCGDEFARLKGIRASPRNARAAGRSLHGGPLRRFDKGVRCVPPPGQVQHRPVVGKVKTVSVRRLGQALVCPLHG